VITGLQSRFRNETRKEYPHLRFHTSHRSFRVSFFLSSTSLPLWTASLNGLAEVAVEEQFEDKWTAWPRRFDQEELLDSMGGDSCSKDHCELLELGSIIGLCMETGRS
jgi:hypothetical protein